jgi:tyrosyl-tRNA synthetase
VIADAFGISRSEGRRLIAQGGVQLDGVPVEEVDLEPDRLDGRVLRVGKRRFRRLKVAR